MDIAVNNGFFNASGFLSVALCDVAKCWKCDCSELRGGGSSEHCNSCTLLLLVLSLAYDYCHFPISPLSSPPRFILTLSTTTTMNSFVNELNGASSLDAFEGGSSLEQHGIPTLDLPNTADVSAHRLRNRAAHSAAAYWLFERVHRRAAGPKLQN